MKSTIFDLDTRKPLESKKGLLLKIMKRITGNVEFSYGVIFRGNGFLIYKLNGEDGIRIGRDGGRFDEEAFFPDGRK